ncbi:MAG: J domain-containing protein [Syntrophaceae bacterium]|nr:J domain-containing protein [Syntrophaceae bacterium]
MSGTTRIRNRNYKVDRARKLLGIPGDATAEDAKRRYRELAKQWHPDVNPGEDAHARMQELNGAYALLMKEEFGVLDPWGEYDRWWWRQFGNDHIWGSHFPETERQETPHRRRRNRLVEK